MKERCYLNEPNDRAGMLAYRLLHWHHKLRLEFDGAIFIIIVLTILNWVVTSPVTIPLLIVSRLSSKTAKKKGDERECSRS